MNMKLVDTGEYVSMLRELTEQGKEVSMIISGSSMNPFLIHRRDMIFFKKPERKLKKGDMVFYQRENGQFVMHRICRVCKNGYDIVGDAQTQIEHGVREEQIFAIVTEVRRKGKMIKPGNFWWEFFEHIWINLIPIRRLLIKLYGIMR